MTKKAFCCQISGFELRSPSLLTYVNCGSSKEVVQLTGNWLKEVLSLQKFPKPPPKSLLDYVRKVK